MCVCVLLASQLSKMMEAVCYAHNMDFAGMPPAVLCTYNTSPILHTSMYVCMMEAACYVHTYPLQNDIKFIHDSKEVVLYFAVMWH